MKRIGQIIYLKPERHADYARIHASVWPDVLATIHRANIRNYSIYHWNGILFAYFEYIGEDFDSDMASIASDPITREWWQLTDLMQSPVQGNSSGSHEGRWWTDMEELFHED